MPRCSILLCKNDSRSVNVSKGGVSYHRYPKDPEAKEKWIEATGRTNWFPKESSVICSEHFDPVCDFLLSTKKKRHIRDNAVPCRKFLSFHDQTPTPAVKPNFKASNDFEDSLPLARVNLQATPGPSRKRAADSSRETSPPKAQQETDAESVKPYNDSSDSMDDDEYQSLSAKEKDLVAMLKYEKEVIHKQTIKLKKLNRNLKRLKTTIVDMEDLYTVLEQKCHISGEDMMTLRTTKVEVSELVTRRQTNKALSEVVSKLTYSEEFRIFALTLHFTSAAAYDYVRKMFKTSLPHPRTLKHWYLRVNGEPGFLKEAFVALKRKADSSEQPILATLVIGVMPMNRHVEVDGKLYGYVNVGTGLETDMLDEAREVLTLSVTAINGHFSIPVAYFLTSIVKSEQQAELVKFGIEMAHDAGIKIVALSFEESLANLATRLGCNFEDVTFPHPVNKEPIVVVLDPSNMLENLKHKLCDFRILIDNDGNKVQWQFLKELNEMRYLSEKIKDQYVDFHSARVKVKQATELFSPKIAEALQYCRKDLKLKAFEGSEPIQTFVTLCSTVFDVFNSINSHVYGYKNALDKNNADQIFEFLTMATEYITNLKTKRLERGPVIRNPKKSLSFVAGIKHLYASLIETNILESLPLYKLSHDHLKLHFWNIKVDAQCKVNSNPTPKKVILAYKKVVTQMKVNIRYKNPPLEQTSIPLSSSPVDRINRIAGYDLKREDKIKDDPDLEETLEILSRNNQVAVIQIAGYVVEQLAKKINCDVCVEALVTNKKSIDNFIVAIDKTRFLYPSLEVIKVCKTTEMFLKGFDGQKSRQAVKGPVMMAKIMHHFVDSKIFDGISYHQVGEFPQSNHVTDLMKAVVERYARVHYRLKLKRETYKDILAQIKEAWMRPPGTNPEPSWAFFR